MKTRKQRVLFARRTYGFGGLEIRLLDWLSFLDYSRYEVFVLTPTDVFSERIARRGIRGTCVPLSNEQCDALFGYYPVPGRHARRKRSFTRLFLTWYKFLRDLRLDTVIMMDATFSDFPLPCVLAAYLATRGNVYMTEHWALLNGPAPRTSRRHFGLLPGLGLWWYRRVLPQILQLRLRAYISKRVLAASETLRDRMLQFYSYPAAKIGIITHGVEANRFEPSPGQREDYRKAHNVPLDADVIVSIARLSPEKNLDWIIEAFHAAAAENGNCFLFIAGEGPTLHDVQRWISSGSGAHRIRLLGHVEDVAPLLRAGDIYVLASMNEGFGIALTEAMAAALVCIATRTPGPDRILDDGADGFLVDVSRECVQQALLQALRLTPEQRRLMGSRARQKILEQYTLQRAVTTAFDLLGLHADARMLASAGCWPHPFQRRVPALRPGLLAKTQSGEREFASGPVPAAEHCESTRRHRRPPLVTPDTRRPLAPATSPSPGRPQVCVPTQDCSHRLLPGAGHRTAPCRWNSFRIGTRTRPAGSAGVPTGSIERRGILYRLGVGDGVGTKASSRISVKNSARL